MKTIILSNEIVECIFMMTRFNYSIESSDFGNGSEQLVFDCEKDYLKFVNLIPAAVEDIAKMKAAGVTTNTYSRF
jgi:hypothetical protein